MDFICIDMHDPLVAEGLLHFRLCLKLIHEGKRSPVREIPDAQDVPANVLLDRLARTVGRSIVDEEGFDTLFLKMLDKFFQIPVFIADTHDGTDIGGSGTLRHQASFPVSVISAHVSDRFCRRESQGTD